MLATTPRSCEIKRSERFRSARSSTRSSRTAACTETSRADVTSSQMITSGWAARARAIATRCRSPPESSRGYSTRQPTREPYPLEKTSCLRIGLATTQAAQDPRRPRDSIIDLMPRIERLGRILENDLNPPPRLARAVFAAAASCTPLRQMVPLTGTCRPAMQRAMVVLPEPDSPTRATHSPCRSSRDTSRAAIVSSERALWPAQSLSTDSSASLPPS